MSKTQSETNSLAIFQRAAVLLAEADTIQKAKELKSLALTAAEWAKRKGMGEAAIHHCRSYALEAERKMGQMLDETDRAKGKLKQGPVVTARNHGESEAPTLASFGVTKRESFEARQLANVPKQEFEELKAGKVTRARLRSNIRRQKMRGDHSKRVAAAQKSSAIVQSRGPFDLILADPPWRYEHCESDTREIENQYSSATLAQIFKHSPNSKDDSILFLWATAPKLAEALQVMEKWGFNYRSCAVWDKTMIGMGYWWRIQHELLLVGVKGKPGCTPECARVSSIFTEPRGKHSVKPAAVYEWIEQAFPSLLKLEMYCRRPRPGWAVHGHEC